MERRWHTFQTSCFSARTFSVTFLGLAAGLLILGAIGSALSAERAPSDAGSQTDALNVPVPHAGDRAVYQYVRQGTGVPSANPGNGSRVLLEFEWTGQSTIRNAQGQNQTVHQARVLDYRFPSVFNGKASVFPKIRSYDAETGALVAVDSSWNRSQVRNEPGPGGVPTTRRIDYEGHTIRYASPANASDVPGLAASEPCGLRMAVQGARVVLGSEIVLFPPCSLAVDAQEPLAFKLRAIDLGDDIPVGHFEAAHGDGSVTRVWMSERSPYPLRIESPDPVAPGAIHVAWLSSFERGEATMGRAVASTEPIPAWVRAPAEPWGLNETGVEHHFPASRALQHALDDPSYADLRDYRKAFPGAYLEAANYEESNTGAQLERWWYLTWWFPGHAFTLCVAQVRSPPAGSFLPAELGRDEARSTSYRYGDCVFEKDRHVAPENAPRELPTAQAALDRWHHYVDAGPEATVPAAWGFSIDCGPTCNEPAVRVHAGRQTSTTTFIPSADNVFVSTRNWNVLRLDADGNAAMREETGLRFAQGFVSVPVATGNPPKEGLAAASAFHVATGPRTLGPTQLAVAGALALLGALALTAWPHVKPVFLYPLFSRVQRHAALDHPRREELLAFVTANPGIHFRELMRRSRMARGVLQHHLDKLVATRHVRRIRAAGYDCYFAAGQKSQPAAVAAILKSPQACRILRRLDRSPDDDPTTLAHHMGITPSTVSYHLGRLRAAGLVYVRRRGHGLACRLTKQGEEWMASTGKSAGA